MIPHDSMILYVMDNHAWQHRLDHHIEMI